MAELAAAGAIFLAPGREGDSGDVLSGEESPRHLAEPESDSISSSDDEPDEDVGEKSKTLPVAKKLAPNNPLKRSFTLPRKPLLGFAKVKKMKDKVEDTCENRAVVRTLISRLVSQASSALARGSVKKKLDTCEERAEEWRRHFSDSNRVPGVMGIRNHGNTCFINAILQCLSYTDILAEYFVLDVYKTDLRRKRRLSALTALQKRRYSPGELTGAGEVTEQLATMLKSLWSLNYDPEMSIRFKAVVEKHANQYKGGSQHDAQEFLLWLLDRVHEDLNVASRHRKGRGQIAVAKKAKASDASCLTNEALAAESLANYANDSFVMDVFQAQFRSSLTCPMCQRQSNTFDPFLCISLPIPQIQLMPVLVTVVYMDQCPRQVKLGLSIGVHETIGDLRAMLSKDTGIAGSDVLLSEIDSLTFRQSFRSAQSVAVLSATMDSTKQEVPAEERSEGKSDDDKSKTSDSNKAAARPGRSMGLLAGSSKLSNARQLYCIEIPPHREPTEDEGAFIVLAWINVLKEGPIERRFGSPFTTQVSREILYQDLQKMLMKEMAPILHDDILISAQKVPLFKIRVHVEGDDEDPCYLDPDVDLPMYTESVEQAINLCKVLNESSDGDAVHLKLILEWDAPAKSQIIADDSDNVEEHSSVREVSGHPDEVSSVSLQECFSLYTKEERLGDGDAWFCPECKRKQEVVKRMGLWSLPDVLILHLKRFRSNGTSACNKLSTMVEFPLENHDMRPFVMNNGSPLNSRARAATRPTHPDKTNWTSFFGGSATAANKERRDCIVMASEADESLYDLYAVCNHHGDDLQGGHYTATCKNPTDGKWYSFDDVHTSFIEDDEVVTQDAYILFYQKRMSSGSSSSSSSTSSTSQDHWVYRMPDFNFKTKQPATTLTAKQKQLANVRAATNGGGISRNSEKYATMPAVSKKAAPARSDGESDATTDVDDVSRPIDKHDVD